MGIVVQEVTFNAPAPMAKAIAARLESLVGQPVIVFDSPPEGDLYDLCVQIAFEMYPNATIGLRAYRGTVRTPSSHRHGRAAD